MKKIVKVNLGCGIHLFKDYINIDNSFTLKDLKSKKGNFKNAVIDKEAKFKKADITKRLPFKDNSIGYVLCVDAIEHLELKQVVPFLSEIYRILKPKGMLWLDTVNFNELAKLWSKFIEGLEIKQQSDLDSYVRLSEIIYGNQIHEGELHKVPFTPEFMKFCLTKAGFKKFTIDIYPTGTKYPKAPDYPTPESNICVTEVILTKAYK